MALPPGAVGSAVTGREISMARGTCKARFFGDCAMNEGGGDAKVVMAFPDTSHMADWIAARYAEILRGRLVGSAQDDSALVG